MFILLPIRQHSRQETTHSRVVNLANKNIFNEQHPLKQREKSTKNWQSP